MAWNIWFFDKKLESSVFRNKNLYESVQFLIQTRLIPGLRSANKTRRYNVTPTLIGWAQT